MSYLATHTKTPATTPAPAVSPKLHIGRELADTTWRIAVPVVLFASLGIFLDLQFGTKPWLTLVGLVVGFFFAAELIKKQIARLPAGHSKTRVTADTQKGNK